MGIAIQNVFYLSIHADEPRQVVNEAECSLCGLKYPKGIADIGICGRKLCRDAYRTSAKLQRQNRRRLFRGSYRVNW